MNPWRRWAERREARRREAVTEQGRDVIMTLTADMPERAMGALAAWDHLQGVSEEESLQIAQWFAQYPYPTPEQIAEAPEAVVRLLMVVHRPPPDVV